MSANPTERAEGARIVQRAVRDVLVGELRGQIPQPIVDRLNAAIVAVVLPLEIEALKGGVPRETPPDDQRGSAR